MRRQRSQIQRVLWLVSAWACSSCVNANPNVVGAVLNTGLAAGAAAANRASGDCYVPCGNGTVCNEKTGYCEALPCHGDCGAMERCDTSGLFEQCVPDVDRSTLETTRPTEAGADTHTSPAATESPPTAVAPPPPESVPASAPTTPPVLNEVPQVPPTDPVPARRIPN
jgi:hypothetical protein